jgi:hypothetical protein
VLPGVLSGGPGTWAVNAGRAEPVLLYPLQALGKMDKAGALGAAGDRSKPVSWDGASLQVSFYTCASFEPQSKRSVVR